MYSIIANICVFIVCIEIIVVLYYLFDKYYCRFSNYGEKKFKNYKCYHFLCSARDQCEVYKWKKDDD